MAEKIVTSNITINASADKVWDALTNPQQTKKYMHGCETVSDWKPGSELLWKGIWGGQEIVAVKGNIVDIEPGKFLAYTTFDPNNTAIEDVPQNYLQVTYTLKPDGNDTKLIVTQGDYTNVADGEQRYNDAVQAGGWSSLLPEIKKVAEE